MLIKKSIHMAQKLETHIVKHFASIVGRMIHFLSTMSYVLFNINTNQQKQ